jgi:AbrB family looped-hinge helix DNA binding protein
MWYNVHMTHTEDSRTVHHAIIQLGDRGRLVIPAALRHQLGLEKGDRLLARVTDSGDLELKSWNAVVDRARGMFAHLQPERMLSEELIADRRAEVAREDAE